MSATAIGAAHIRDAYSPGARRDDAMSRLDAAYAAWSTWAKERQSAAMRRVVELLIRRVLPIALRTEELDAESSELLDSAAERCESDGDTASARAAEQAARYAGADGARAAATTIVEAAIAVADDYDIVAVTAGDVALAAAETAEATSDAERTLDVVVECYIEGSEVEIMSFARAIILAAKWVWTWLPSERDERAMGANLVAADGVELAGCIVDNEDVDIRSDCCGVTAAGEALGLTDDDIDWPDDDDAAAAYALEMARLEAL